MSQAVLELLERNDANILVSINNPDGSAFNLTGFSIEFYAKPTPEATDGMPLYTTANGAITITMPETLGTLNIQTSGVDFANGELKWYRIDGVKAGRRITLGYGLLRIKDI